MIHEYQHGWAHILTSDGVDYSPVTEPLRGDEHPTDHDHDEQCEHANHWLRGLVTDALAARAAHHEEDDDDQTD
ncbi:MAG: hypothetical protein ACRDYU_07990 [Actinomycetes bacterium]